MRALRQEVLHEKGRAAPPGGAHGHARLPLPVLPAAVRPEGPPGAAHQEVPLEEHAGRAAEGRAGRDGRREDGIPRDLRQDRDDLRVERLQLGAVQPARVQHRDVQRDRSDFRSGECVCDCKGPVDCGNSLADELGTAAVPAVYFNAAAGSGRVLPERAGGRGRSTAGPAGPGRHKSPAAGGDCFNSRLGDNKTS